MVTRIRKGARPHVYLREWRQFKTLKATAMAERLGIERESYYRLEREPYKLSVGEVVELADALGIDPKQLFAPPSAPKPEESLDALVEGAPDAQRTKAFDLLKVLLGKTG